MKLCAVCGFPSRHGVIYAWTLEGGWEIFACVDCFSNPAFFMNCKRYEIPRLPPLQMRMDRWFYE